MAIGALWQEDPSALPRIPDLLEVLARSDERDPGLADAFLAPLVPGVRERDLLEPWVLGVLEARSHSKRAPSPMALRGLEDRAQEWFADNPDALRSLLGWGYHHLVSLALEHGALPREQDIGLLETLFTEHGHSEAAMALATRYGVLLPVAIAKCAETDVDDIPANVLARAYGARSQWLAQWVFFRDAPFPIPRSREDGATVLARLRANALLPGEIEGIIIPREISHIPFPSIAGTTRRSFTPRQDVALDLAVRTRSNDVLALRLVRARRGTATVHSLEPKRRA